MIIATRYHGSFFLPHMLCVLMMLLHSPAFAQAESEQVGPKLEGDQTYQASKKPSLMFSKSELQNLTKVMMALESGSVSKMNFNLDSSQIGNDEIFRELRRRAEVKKEEKKAETTLPDFYISSLIYRSQDDWTVWLRKFRFEQLAISSQLTQMLDAQGDNTAEELMQNSVKALPTSDLIVLSADRPVGDSGRLTVIDISPDAVTLSYVPDASAAAYNRYQQKKLPTPRVKMFDNRIVDKVIAYDDELNTFEVKLEPNQSFSINMMRVVEGRTVNLQQVIKAEAQKTQQPQNQEEADTGDGMQFIIQNDSLEANAANKLIQDYQKVNQLLQPN